MQRMFAVLSVALACGAAGCGAVEDASVGASHPRPGTRHPGITPPGVVAKCPDARAPPRAPPQAEVECSCAGATTAAAAAQALETPGAASRAPTRVAATLAVQARAVDANSATSPELEAISGIGPALAARIVEERSGAPFRSLEDLQERVRGVGENNLRKMRENGLAVGRPDAGNGVETIVGGAREAPAAKGAKRTSKKTVQPAQRKQRGQ